MLLDGDWNAWSFFLHCKLQLFHHMAEALQHLFIEMDGKLCLWSFIQAG